MSRYSSGMIFDSVLPFSLATKKMIYRVLMAVCFFLGIGSIGYGVWLYVGATQAYGAGELEVVVCESEDSPPPPESNIIVVAISGAVTSPGMYEMSPGSRVGDVIAAAGEFTAEADEMYIETALNLARELRDGEGVYVPTKRDADVITACGELSQLLQAARSSPDTISTPSISTASLISVNTASLEDLDTLPGIGEKRAEAIIEGRPYSSLDELIEKKIITESILDDLESLIQL